VHAVRFVAVGDVMVDVLVAGRGHGARVELGPGGTAVNAATAAFAAGAGAEIVGRIGDDAGGRMIASELAGPPVEASLSVDPERPTGTFLVIDGEIRVERGANTGLLPEHLPETLAADVVLVSGHLRPETVEAALGRSSASWTALTPGLLGELPPGGDAIVLDEDEARRLTGAGAGEAARVLGDRYRLACVTLGADGAIAVLNGASESVRPPWIVAGDRPGAGDAFAAATLVALVRGSALSDALAEGCRMGALAIGEARPARE
jgi:ribokinase